MHDPGLLAIPIDPMDALSRRLNLSKLESYDEELEANPEVVQYIKKVMIVPGKRLKSQKVWDEDGDGMLYYQA